MSRFLAQLLPLVLILALFWLLVLRPARRRNQAMRTLQSNLQPGTEVMLSSGIFGSVESLDGDVLHLQLAPGFTVRVHRQAVGRVAAPEESASSAPPNTGATAPPQTGTTAPPSSSTGGSSLPATHTEG